MTEPIEKQCQFKAHDGKCNALVCYADNLFDCGGRDKNGFPNYVFSGGSGEVKNKEDEN